MAETTKGLDSFEDAVEAARAHLEESGESTETAVDQAAPQAQPEQPSVEAETSSVFGDIAEDLQAETAPDPLQATVEVKVGDTVETHTVDELRSGYMRQADYTRKTQELAEASKRFERESSQAQKLFEALQKDPAGTVASLAVELKLIDPNEISAQKVRDLNDIYKVPSREDVERQVEERAKQLASEAPEVQAARVAQEIAAIETEFKSIEETYGTQFSDSDRDLIMREAVRRNTTDLELAFIALKERAEQVRAKRSNASQAAPVRSKGLSTSEESTGTAKQGPAGTFEEAVARATSKIAATQS